MDLQWTQESPARWDANKARIVGGAPAGIFDRRYAETKEGDVIPGDWWRVESAGEVVGYGWMDVVWGDAEILLAAAPEHQGKGVGRYILEHLEAEAQKRGLNYVYNTIRPTHPDAERLSKWLSAHGFEGSEDGSLFRSAARSRAT